MFVNTLQILTLTYIHTHICFRKSLYFTNIYKFRMNTLTNTLWQIWIIITYTESISNFIYALHPYTPKHWNKGKGFTSALQLSIRPFLTILTNFSHPFNHLLKFCFLRVGQVRLQLLCQPTDNIPYPTQENHPGQTDTLLVIGGCI